MLVRDMPGCRGCPLYQDGSQPFVKDELVEGAPVMVMGQNPGEEEEANGKPFVGKTGRTMERVYFHAAQVVRGGVSISNALRCRWQGTNELPKLVTPKQSEAGKRGIAEEALLHCQRAHGRIPSGTKLIVTQGEFSLWSVTGQRSVTSWRGWLLPVRGQSEGWKSQIWTPTPHELPVLATVHLASLWRGTKQKKGDEKGGGANGGLIEATYRDWKKIPKILKGVWPVGLPSFTTEPPRVWPQVSAFDTEFIPETGELLRYSMYDSRHTLRVVEAEHASRVSMEGETGIQNTVFMHNIEADILHLERLLGARAQELRLEDTMLMHAVLWSDLPHDLEYLASLFGRLNRHKHLFLSNPLAYSAGDAVATWDVATYFMRQFKEDPQSWRVYRESVFPLIPIIGEAERVGMRLDRAKVDQAITHFSREKAEVEQEAQAYAGYPVNLGSSDQLSRWLYEVEKVGVKAKRSKVRNT